MLVNNDLLKIQALPYDEDGNRLEPEQMPAERILPVSAPVTGNLTGGTLGQLKTSINIQRTAHVFANGLRSMCGACKHFNSRRWQQKTAALSGTKEGVQTLNGIRQELIFQGLGPDLSVAELHTTPDGEDDVEAAIAVMGVCNALSEHYRDDIVVHPFGGCPTEVITDQQPLGFFEDQSSDTARKGAEDYDRIMRAAQGEPTK